VKPIEVTLVATVADHTKGPKDMLPQVAFAGRSNVGKSTLLNTILGTKLAGVSKQPGKTRTINFYLVNRNSFFVDLPGYGFARASQEERDAWGRRITTYVSGEPRLKLVVGLVDPRIPTSPLDLDLVSFVHAAGKRLLIVLTKADKLSKNELAKATARAIRELELDSDPIAFSAVTGNGRKEILAAIADALVA
jgi:GTP-binding protein